MAVIDSNGVVRWGQSTRVEAAHRKTILLPKSAGQKRRAVQVADHRAIAADMVEAKQQQNSQGRALTMPVSATALRIL